MSLSDKKYEKIEKILGKPWMGDMDALSRQELQASIAQAEGAIKSTSDELEANEEYQSRKQAVLDMSQGLKEVRKRQKAIVEYALHLIEESGK